MAEQSVDLPVASERAKSWEVELRRHSTGKASFGNNKENVISRYLKASTGSCHDFCKYGRNYAFEANEKHSLSRRASLDSKLMKMSMVERRKSIDSKLQISCTSYTTKLELPTKSSDSKKQIGNEVLINRNKASLVKVKPPHFQKTHVSSIPKTTSHEFSSAFKVETKLKSTSKKKETPLKSTSGRAKAHSEATSKKMETSSKLSSFKVRAMELSEKPAISLNPNSVSVQTKSSMDSSRSFGGQRSTNIKLEKSSCKVVSPSIALLSSKPSHKRNASINARKHKSLKMKTSSKLSSFKVRAMELSEKPVISLNPNSVPVQKISSMDSSERFRGQRSTEIKMEKSSCKVVSPSRCLLSSKPSHKRNASINTRKHKSLKIVSRLKNQPKPRRFEPKKHNGDFEERTLYVINMDDSDNQTLQSDQNGSQDIESSISHCLSSPNLSSSIFQSISQEDQEEFEYATSEFDEDSSSQNCETEYIDNEESLEVEENGKPQKGETIFLEYKDCQMLKLKMVREKKFETQSEKICPRRLKFRRGKVLENNPTDIKVGADNNGDTTGTTKVNLRHLELEGKKDGQRLLNNLIEETTSKLVESQKGRVKALIRAFEIIISLQEKKPFANIIS